MEEEEEEDEEEDERSVDLLGEVKERFKNQVTESARTHIYYRSIQVTR